MKPFFCSIFKKIIYYICPQLNLWVNFPFSLVHAESPACLKPHSSVCVLTDHLILIYMPELWCRGPLAGTANQLLDCWWHCQWKRLVCKVQTTSTTLLNKKALVKAFGSDAILMGVTCKYAMAVTWWPSTGSCFVLCTHVRQKCVHARAPVPRHEEQRCSCLYDLSL